MPEIPYQLKQEFVRRFCDLTEEEKINALDTLADSGWEGIFKAIADQVRALQTESDIELVAAFLEPDKAMQGWVGSILPTITSATISCKLPKNEHTNTVHKQYKCSNTDSSQIHRFCYHHDLVNMRCPIDDTTLTVI